MDEGRKAIKHWKEDPKLSRANFNPVTPGLAHQVGGVLICILPQLGKPWPSVSDICNTCLLLWSQFYLVSVTSLGRYPMILGSPLWLKSHLRSFMHRPIWSSLQEIQPCTLPGLLGFSLEPWCRSPWPNNSCFLFSAYMYNKHHMDDVDFCCQPNVTLGLLDLNLQMPV